MPWPKLEYFVALLVGGPFDGLRMRLRDDIDGVAKITEDGSVVGYRRSCEVANGDVVFYLEP